MMPLFLRYKKYAEVTVIADSNLDSLQVKLNRLQPLLLDITSPMLLLKG
jgi:hypothetical protein